MHACRLCMGVRLKGCGLELILPYLACARTWSCRKAQCLNTGTERRIHVYAETCSAHAHIAAKKESSQRYYHLSRASTKSKLPIRKAGAARSNRVRRSCRSTQRSLSTKDMNNYTIPATAYLPTTYNHFTISLNIPSSSKDTTPSTRYRNLASDMDLQQIAL